jgi:hypothetical protein
VVAVVGVGRMAGLRSGKHQPLSAHNHEEAVTSGHIVTPKQADEHQP